MQPGLASIILPTYNRAHLLADALRSALAQDYPHKQIIVVDDGSTDDTRQLVSGFAGVEYLYQPNRGQAAARNAGLRRCRGEFVASLDSDDIWDPGFLSSGIDQLAGQEASFVFMNWRASNGHNGLESFFQAAATQRRFLTQAVGDWWQLSAAQTRRLMLETCPAPSSALIIRRQAMPAGWNEQMLIADDWCLLLDLVLRQAVTAAFTLVPHWLKRIHGENIYDGRSYVAVARELTDHDESLLLRRYRPQLARSEVLLFKHRQARDYIQYAYNSYRDRQQAALLRHLLRAFWLAPVATSGRLVRGGLAFVRRYVRSV